MKKVICKVWVLVVAPLVAACLASCVMGRSSVAGEGQLEGYGYAVLQGAESGYGGRADLACVQSQIYSALESTRLEMVGDMSVDDLATLDGGKCILQVRGLRPFLSDKYDITKHPNYKYLSDADKRNTFDVEKYMSCRLKLKADEEYDVYEIDEADDET